MARPSRGPSIVRFLVLIAVAALILFFVGRFIVGLFTGSAQAERAKVTVTVSEDPVSTAVDDGLLERTTGEAALYAGDRVTTGNDGKAMLSFLDGTRIAMDEQSDVTIVESDRGEESSMIALKMEMGALWIETPAGNSGSITRTIATGDIKLSFGGGIKALVEEESVFVFEDGGQGVMVMTLDDEGATEISEGQRLIVDGGVDASNVRSYRSALMPSDWEKLFVRENTGRTEDDSLSGSGVTTDTLTVTAPIDNAVVTSATVKVEGKLGDEVDRVRVNGYAAAINRTAGTYSQELAMPADGEMSVLVEAINESGIVTAQIRRSVKREAKALEPPSFTEPAKTGETYTTNDVEIIIRGKAPEGAQGIQVNDYKLQLFKPGNTDWSYLASVELDNLKQGTNLFNVVAIGADGKPSEPATLTIVLGSPSSVSGSAGSAASNASSVIQVDETTLPQNAPINPGTLKITAPTSGEEFTATGAEVVIYGTTPGGTQSIWVNGYKLQLYEPGRRTWNYLANTNLGNLKRGRNEYKITARNKENNILDTLIYVITLDPRKN